MDKAKNEAIKKATTFDELLDAEYGKIGAPKRDKFDADAAALCLAEMLKEECLLQHLMFFSGYLIESV